MQERRVGNFKVVGDVLGEMDRQFEKWGEQNHPEGEIGCEGYTDEKELWQELNDADWVAGMTRWDRVLLEEVYEALSERDPVLRRQELIQVAAVCASWVAAMDRRGT